MGYSVHSDKPQDIVEKIQLIIKNYEELSVNALEGYVKFNWDSLSENYLKIYSKLVDKNKQEKEDKR